MTRAQVALVPRTATVYCGALERNATYGIPITYSQGAFSIACSTSIDHLYAGDLPEHRGSGRAEESVHCVGRPRSRRNICGGSVAAARAFEGELEPLWIPSRNKSAPKSCRAFGPRIRDRRLRFASSFSDLGIGIACTRRICPAALILCSVPGVGSFSSTVVSGIATGIASSRGCPNPAWNSGGPSWRETASVTIETRGPSRERGGRC